MAEYIAMIKAMPASHGHVVAEEIDALYMEVCRIHLLRDAYLDLLRSQIGERPAGWIPSSLHRCLRRS